MKVKPVNDPAVHSFLSVSARYLGVVEQRNRAPRPAQAMPSPSRIPTLTRPAG